MESTMKNDIVIQMIVMLVLANCVLFHLEPGLLLLSLKYTKLICLILNVITERTWSKIASVILKHKECC